jgi:hypothetical protein
VAVGIEGAKKYFLRCRRAYLSRTVMRQKLPGGFSELASHKPTCTKTYRYRLAKLLNVEHRIKVEDECGRSVPAALSRPTRTALGTVLARRASLAQLESPFPSHLELTNRAAFAPDRIMARDNHVPKANSRPLHRQTCETRRLSRSRPRSATRQHRNLERPIPTYRYRTGDHDRSQTCG